MSVIPKTDYIGRFAPSPTGPLHLGSLCTALASYLDARAHRGQWLLRIENLDPPREQEGADKLIIDALQAHGLHWDGGILWQSNRHAAYADALGQLLDQGDAFYCSCSRAQLAEHDGIHRGDCIAELNPNDAAVRLRANSRRYDIPDRHLGAQHCCPADGGDVVLRRRDGLFAYQLAVVVDDAFSGITDIVRGSDLLDSTAWQWQLQSCLDFPHPRYLHLPLLVDAQGDKLSKRSYAPALDNDQAEQNLRLALRYLGQPAPPDQTSLDALLRWSTEHWQVEQLPKAAIIAD